MVLRCWWKSGRAGRVRKPVAAHGYMNGRGPKLALGGTKRSGGFPYPRRTGTTYRLRFCILEPPVHQLVTQPPRAAATKNAGTAIWKFRNDWVRGSCEDGPCSNKKNVGAAIGQMRNDWVRGSCKGDPCSHNEKRGCCDWANEKRLG